MEFVPFNLPALIRDFVDFSKKKTNLVVGIWLQMEDANRIYRKD